MLKKADTPQKENKWCNICEVLYVCFIRCFSVFPLYVLVCVCVLLCATHVFSLSFSSSLDQDHNLSLLLNLTCTIYVRARTHGHTNLLFPECIHCFVEGGVNKRSRLIDWLRRESERPQPSMAWHDTQTQTLTHHSWNLLLSTESEGNLERKSWKTQSSRHISLWLMCMSVCANACVSMCVWDATRWLIDTTNTKTSAVPSLTPLYQPKSLTVNSPCVNNLHKNTRKPGNVLHKISMHM